MWDMTKLNGVQKGQTERVWTTETEAAFQTLMENLSSSPRASAAPLSSRPLRLPMVLGTVQSQTKDGEEHPVVYIRRKLTPAETRYAMLEKEPWPSNGLSWSSGITSWV